MESKKKSIFSSLKKDDLGLKLILVLFMLLVLTLFLHFREIRLDILELNSKASKYFVSQVDFKFLDDEATIISKQKRVSSINPIYFIDLNEIKIKRMNFENHLICNPNWHNLPFISYDTLNELVDRFEKKLIKAKFTDSQTIKKLKKNKIDTFNYFSINHENKNEFHLPQGYCSIIANELKAQLSANIHPAINFIRDYFESVNYKLKIDYHSSARVKNQIEKNTVPKYTSVSAGEIIIASNEKVTAKHVVMLQAMKAALTKKRNLFEPLTIFGNVLIAATFIFLAILYLKADQEEISKSFKQLALITTIVILTLVFAKILELILLKSSNSFSEAMRYPIIVPFAALIFRILFNLRLSLFFSMILCIILASFSAMDHHSFLLSNLVASLIAIISTEALRKRTQVFNVCLKSLLGVVIVTVAFALIKKNTLFNSSLISNIISSAILLCIIGIMVVGLLPILESLFDVLTDITLMEYMDPNNELLRRLTLEVPGSYQHSLVLGNLAEAAAQEINANALFCRVATLYHDIGKLTNPSYFIENQSSGVNIHQLLTPKESAEVIISHVIAGELLAKKYRLPKKIIDMIKQHHGTTLVVYFYRKELDIKKSADKVQENNFRYLGPKPKSKEAAIIMIADAMEAASRSLEEVSKEELEALINQIVKDRTEDGQLDDCLLTFEELKMIKRSIVRTLFLTRHGRIKYPDRKKQKLSLYLDPYLVNKSS
jgi:cyclic-di-AMP phosphodiesterase PgpH